MEGNILPKERTKTINNKIKLHILGVPMNKLDSWLIGRETKWTRRNVLLVQLIAPTNG